MYTWKFNKSIAFTMAMEGGTNPDLLDRGGFTKYGISTREYSHLDINAITHGQAVEIYHEDYWLHNRCESFSVPLSCVLFDSSVNCGQGSAARWLQSTISSLKSDILVDGIIGSKTIVAAHQQDDRAILEGIVARRLDRYTRLLTDHPEQVKFIKGWINRVSALLKYNRLDHTP